MLLWDDSGHDVQFGLVGVPWTPSLAVLLQDMVQARAFQESVHSYVVGDEDVEKQLILQGLATKEMTACCATGPGFAKWQVTAYGSQNLQVAHQLRRPARVFTKIAHISLENLLEASAWELLEALKDNGYHLSLRPRRSVLPPHTHDSAHKVVYMQSKMVSKLAYRRYFTVMLLSEQFFQAGYQEVHHLQSAAYYQAFLEGSPQPLPKHQPHPQEPDFASDVEEAFSAGRPVPGVGGKRRKMLHAHNLQGAQRKPVKAGGRNRHARV